MATDSEFRPKGPRRGLVKFFEFEGRKLTTIAYQGKRWWIAREVGAAMQYGAEGKKLVDLIGAEWSEEFDEDDRWLVQGDDLRAIKTILKDEQLGLGRYHQPSLLLLSESGIYKAAILSRKPEGRRLRNWIAKEVLPEIARTGGFVSGMTEEQARLTIEGLRHKLEAERQAHIAAALSLEQQVQGNARLSLENGDLKKQLRVLASGGLKDLPLTLKWVHSSIRQIAMLRCYAQTAVEGETPLTNAEARGKVAEDLRRSLDFFHLPWEEFPFGRMDEMRRWMKWLHRDALKAAKRRGFGGDGMWSQPPLPFTARDDDSDD